MTRSRLQKKIGNRAQNLKIRLGCVVKTGSIYEDNAMILGWMSGSYGSDVCSERSQFMADSKAALTGSTFNELVNYSSDGEVIDSRRSLLYFSRHQ